MKTAVKILKIVGRTAASVIIWAAGMQAGDTIIFGSVSRMSRDAEEGFQLYEDLSETFLITIMSDVL